MLTISDAKADGDLDALFGALADPTRRAIVARLSTSEATVLELAAPFSMSLPAISRHLKVLERAQLITRSRHGRERPCRLRPESLHEVAHWATLTRDAWVERLDRLDHFLQSEDPDRPAEEPTT